MPKLIVTKGPMKGHVFLFEEEVNFVGRSSDNEIQLLGREISRKHFKISAKNKKIYIEDLKSRNGTCVNGKKVAPGEKYEVSEDDTLSIGKTKFRIGQFPDVKVSSKVDVSSQQDKRVSGDSKEKEETSKERRSLERKSLELIWEVTDLLRKSISIDEVLERILTLIMDALPRIDTAAIILYDKDKQDIIKVFSTERFENIMEEVRFSRSVVDRVIESGKAVRMSNTAYEPPEDLSASITDLKIRSIMCVPLISNAISLGAIYVDSRGVYGFRKDDLLLLNSLSGPVAIAVEKAQLVMRLEETPPPKEEDDSVSV